MTPRGRHLGVLAVATAVGSAAAFVPSCAPEPLEPQRTTTPVALESPVDPPAQTEQPTVDPVPGGLVDTSDLEVPAAPLVLPPKERPLPPREEPTMAVRIGSVPAGGTIAIGCDVALRVQSSDENGSASSWKVTPPIDVRATKSGWIVEARGANASRARREFPPCELVLVADSAGSHPVEWNKVDWPGALRLVVVDAVTPKTGASAPAKIDLVMDIAMEQYLPGVIAKELYGSWDPETFEAQAIAARSYAVVEKDRWAGRRHYDLVAGQQSQAWEGATTNRRALDAVRETRGKVLVFDGRVVPAYYSSACGGHPASALGTVTDNPFHDIRPISAGDDSPRKGPCCGASSVASWRVTIPLAQVRARLVAWGKANGRADLVAIEVPTAIKVHEKNSAGRAEVLVVESAKRSCEISSEDFRWAMNAPRDKATMLKSGDLSAKVVRSGTGGTVEFTGHGFGHGVGMCQHGAQTTAAGGASAQKILARYYAGATIEQAWR